MRSWFGLDDKLLQPLLARAMVTVAMRRGAEPARLLRGTGLFESDLDSRLICARQLIKLAMQVQKQLAQPDLGFLVGHHLLRLNHPLAQALRHAPDLRHALLVLARHRQQLPLLQYLRLEASSERLHCYLQDSVGLGDSRGFFLQVTLGILSALIRLQLDGRQQLEISLSQSQPKALHLYQTHLGLALEFNAPSDGISLPRSWWQAAFRDSDTERFALANRQLASQLMPLGLLEWLARLQHRNLKSPLGLEAAAELAGVSVASFKRQLKDQGSSFKANTDSVKKLRALHWLCHGDLPNEVLAKRLGYSDVHNFRRSFKRWTGAVPSVFR
ncbi:helix-turn-helix domain-containing protein [Gallaecimonas mangrovi]|uniref:helix-turn-helix domain-containing protein n=1 Tax=Gallaecimonas mangrovi TaxID=2291597 RepID=UPI000E20A057|nr:AraC family transcriptional regulator ligand-binding domain-containing protein [Gallaecimonas mangrovi]